MLYSVFHKKVLELTKLIVDHPLDSPKIQGEIKLLEDEILNQIKTERIQAKPKDYYRLRFIKNEKLLQALCSVDKSKIAYDLWLKLKDLEAAAFDGKLEEVTELLEDDAVKTKAAFNQNCVLNEAARANHRHVIDYLLFIPSIAQFLVAKIKYEQEAFSRNKFLNFLKFAKEAESRESKIDYIKLAAELLHNGEITDLDWRYLLHTLDAFRGTHQEFYSLISCITVFPSVRKYASEDAEFHELLRKTIEWLSKQTKHQPKPIELPHVGPYVVRLGVSAFNRVAYENFLDKKRADDELRKYYSEEMLQEKYPERFKPKGDKNAMHSFTIENNKITYNGYVRKPGGR